MNREWNSTTYAVAHHVYFIYDTLERSTLWQPTLLMESYTEPFVHIYGKTYRAKSVWDVVDMDVIIESSAAFPDNRLITRHPNKKFVHFNQGPFYFQSLTNLKANLQMPTHVIRRFHAIWVTPQYEWQAPFIAEWTRTNKWAVAPYVWSPKRLPTTYNYKPGTARRVGVYETNRGVYKMSIIPIMIGNRAFRDGTNISYFEAPALKHTWTDTYREVLDDFELNIHAKPGLVKIPQHYADERIGSIVSHQMRCGLNYLYLEALYMNMSLVHNSEYIKECGYYYPGFDIEEGARVLRHAIETHDDNLQAYATASAKCLWKYAPENPDNLKLYEKLLNDLF